MAEKRHAGKPFMSSIKFQEISNSKIKNRKGIGITNTIIQFRLLCEI